jgi:RNA polymerase sigma-70 factor, ECF subfamily
MQSIDLEQMLERLHRESYAWALGCCRGRVSEAEDVLQTAYVKVLDGRAKFEGRSAFKTWLFSVIRRTAWESRPRRAFESLIFHDPPQPAEAEAALERSETRRHLWNALENISGRQRETLLLVFYHGLTVEEAASALGISVGTARVHYERGKRNLLARLDGKLR